MVSTSFWSDHYVADLDPTEKLLFLYLLTCERSTLAGVYELPLKVMAVESGIETEMVRKVLLRFEGDDKVKFQEGWVAIKNFLKHHEHGSPTVRKGIDDAVLAAPAWAKEFIGKGIDTLTPSSLSFTSSSVSAKAPIEVVKIPKEGTEKRESTAKYPDAKKVFRIFPHYPRTWDVNTTFLRAAQSLYEERGIEELTELYDWYKKNRRRDYCPQFDDPNEWLKKYEAVNRFFDKTNT